MPPDEIGPLAQLDSAAVFYPAGSWFKSTAGHQTNTTETRYNFVAQPGLDLSDENR